MILLWLVLGTMVLVALAVVLPPLMGRGAAAGPARASIYRALHRKRLAELEGDLESGTLSAEQFEQARAEIERDTLENLEGAVVAPAVGPRRRHRWMVVVVALIIPVFTGGIYWRLGGWALVSPDARARIAAEAVAQGDTDPAVIQDMVTGLAARLKRKPDDLQGWMMLGRSYRVLNRFDQAADAYGKAYALSNKKDPALLADYAEVLALAHGNRLAGKPEQLLTRALALDPQQPKALWLTGWAAYQSGDYAQAAARWKPLAKRAPAGSDVARILEKQIAQAEALAGRATRAPSERAPARTRETASIARKALTVQVRLAAALAHKVRPGETVFIYARALQGPPMPLAAVRRQVKDLPTTVVLDDTQSMLPGRTLSQQAEVVVGARISRTGNALAAPGDLQGLSAPVAPGRKGVVELTIDRVIP
ncbi:MAG: c-type cytochrome biogenesis protein CcmI [Chromatiales bacterium 21-64-14]|nr:MAG: c-type cytochrome biogenesis protein CcmI [Chromatiales bacterium 21-64-14]HQU14617.1 c-type cytochrome biogenesis protein CcmI [Gammaproteobacteria bacterium]